MNFSALLNLLPLIMQGVDLARSINNQRTDGAQVIDIVRSSLPTVFNLFTSVGQTLFPELPAQSQVGAASVVLDTERTKRIQTALNAKGAALVVDGRYGSATKAAVSAFQRANPPLVVDGWAGVATQKVLSV